MNPRPDFFGSMIIERSVYRDASKQFDRYMFAQPSSVSKFSFGRNPGNDLVIPLTTVSGNHGRVLYSQGVIFEDSSKNRTNFTWRTRNGWEQFSTRNSPRYQVTRVKLMEEEDVEEALNQSRGSKYELGKITFNSARTGHRVSLDISLLPRRIAEGLRSSRLNDLQLIVSNTQTIIP